MTQFHVANTHLRCLGVKHTFLDSSYTYTVFQLLLDSYIVYNGKFKPWSVPCGLCCTDPRLLPEL